MYFNKKINHLKSYQNDKPLIENRNRPIQILAYRF